MLSPTNITQVSQGELASRTAGIESPETGKFDFLNYFLGLQVAQSENTTADSQLGIEGEKDLVSEGKNSSPEDSQWNLIFPGVSPIQPNLISTSDGNAPKISELEANAETEPWKNSQELLDARSAPLADNEGKPNLEVQASERNQVIEKYLEVAGNERAAMKPATAAASKLPDEALNPEVIISGAKAAMGDLEAGEVDSGLNDREAKGDSFVVPVGLNVQSVRVETPVVPTVQRPETTQPVPELFQRVESLVHQGGGKMTVTLNPPELGQVEIQVTAKGNRVQIAMRSEEASTKHLIESQLSDLKNSIQSQDLVVSKLEVQMTENHFRSQIDPQVNSQTSQFQNFREQSAFSDSNSSGRFARSGRGEAIDNSRLALGARLASTQGVLAGSGRVDLKI